MLVLALALCMIFGTVDLAGFDSDGLRPTQESTAQVAVAAPSFGATVLGSRDATKIRSGAAEKSQHLNAVCIAESASPLMLRHYQPLTFSSPHNLSVPLSAASGRSPPFLMI